MFKKKICQILIMSLMLSACQNGVGNNTATGNQSSKGNKLLSANDISDKELNKEEYRRNVLEMNDVLIFNQTAGGDRIIYINATDGLKIWSGTNTTVSEEISTDDNKFREFIKQNLGNFKPVNNTNGQVYKPNNSDAIYYDEVFSRLHWLSFDGPNNWQELALDVSNPDAKVQILQTEKM